ncbi:MAG: PIN domain-containing protein [Promicromonosporaceae bacterium]|nr:PIN domain-containing protein [Promicromonosporaceae bacterium]
MIVLDASVVIAYLETTDPHHEAAVRFMAAVIEELAISSVTLAEVLVGRIDDGTERQVRDAITEVMAVQVLVNADDEWPLDLARAKAKFRLRMPDAIVLASAMRAGGTVATFDKRLRTAASAAGCLAEENGLW